MEKVVAVPPGWYNRAMPFVEPGPNAVEDLLHRYWGFSELRPLQGEAIRALTEDRDALIVLPTGGGKSLCYQLPPLLQDRCAVVVSPLISLMKDQVDGLRANGYPARALHSGQSGSENHNSLQSVREGRCRLLFVSPERLLREHFLTSIAGCGVRTFAIDEAHCISHWGHDFRPQYRRLSELKQRFPQAVVAAFTATATEPVQKDIVTQLRLNEPKVLIGTFDRPNLIYRVVPRQNLTRQVLEVVKRHSGEAGIVYCISRKQTDSMTDRLVEAGIRATCYHAGLGSAERRSAQDAFTRSEVDVVVATVAFGMGIDRSDIRFVVHAGMPKSIEHYQQETGRAGRDGLPAECVLFYSPVDVMTWQSLISKSEAGDEVRGNMRRLLNEMRRYCAPGGCRHRTLSEYFGQPFEREDCEACDLCLGESEGLEDSTDMARKVLSAVARVDQRFGVGHVVEVLRGSNSAQVKRWHHDQLSTFGLLAGIPARTLTYFIYQLVDQKLLHRTDGDYPVLQLADRALPVLRGEKIVRTVPLRTRKAVRSTRAEAETWEGVDRDLFDRLRRLRTDLARRRGVPPYVIFSDVSLRHMTRLRPATEEDFLTVHGVGDKKLADFGAAFLDVVREFEAESREE